MDLLKNKVHQRSIERLRKRIIFLEKQNATLIKENSDLKRKIESYESIIDEVQKTESEYRAGIEEMQSLKMKYRQAISDVSTIKSNYSKEMKTLLKNLKKEL